MCMNKNLIFKCTFINDQLFGANTYFSHRNILTIVFRKLKKLYIFVKVVYELKSYKINEII